MASSESSPNAWWHCFFLYDGSKVKEEGDPTRAGICYFHPKETPMERQELLCGQLAGMLRCVSEISGSAPDLIRFRKLKFSIGTHGEFLWVLGCEAGTPDSACKQLQRNLMGIFRFYHGTLQKAYAVHSKEELGCKWEKYIEYLLRNTSDLHRIFNSLWALDKTKVEPLLLLKAALILQSCQRVTHVLGGCILFHGQVVSTQLPPDLTAKVMIQEAEIQEGQLPPGVQMLPVFLSKQEVASLRDFPLEWTSGVQEVSAEGSSPFAEDDLSPGSDPSSSSLERMTLYVHCVRSVTLCLLAEEAFKDPEGVFQSSLASLNGLEVHLRETQIQDGRPHAKATPSYTFGHFDSTQRILTSNFLPWDHLFLRAASRIHDTFEQIPSASEISVRSGGSSCACSLYALRGPLLLQEAYYFPAAGPHLSPPPPSSFGGPDTKDALFLLPGKAKQKLLKHGFNLL
ncbi:BLOC-3 complex member HPS4 [Anolis sagrei]|uniref:BLOC-3 complex member HPS4 n=1 Tax=Anolis sagrei TaxID=38937 RepID=UPI0035212824